jgi:uncharacterized membrane protein HdeD (DUF308 family)
MNRTESKERTLWGVPMTFGVLMIIGGAFALGAAAMTSLVSVLYIGVMLIAVGVLDLVTGFRLGKGGHVLAFVAAGLLAIAVGAMLLARPLEGVASLTLLIAAYLFASGIFRGVTSVADRYPGWGWDLAYSIIALVLGVYVVAWWPISSFWVLGTVVGAEIMVRGAALVAGALALRDLEHGPA